MPFSSLALEPITRLRLVVLIPFLHFVLLCTKKPMKGLSCSLAFNGISAPACAWAFSLSSLALEPITRLRLVVLIPFLHFVLFMHKKADEGIRTRDLLITNELLYQLSYIGIYLVYFSESSIRHRSTF